MGCVVNGFGESKAANIGISLSGTGESPNGPCSSAACIRRRPRRNYYELAVGFQKLIDDYVERKYHA